MDKRECALCALPDDDPRDEAVCRDLAALADGDEEPGRFAAAIRLGGLWFDAEDVRWHWWRLRDLRWI